MPWPLQCLDKPLATDPSPEEAQHPDGQMQPAGRVRAVRLVPPRQVRRRGRHQLPQGTDGVLLHGIAGFNDRRRAVLHLLAMYKLRPRETPAVGP